MDEPCGSARPLHRPPTPRQLEVLEGIYDGLTYEGIAKRLGVSRSIVGSHVSEILRRMDVTSSTQAVMMAIRYDWLDVELDAKSMRDIQQCVLRRLMRQLADAVRARSEQTLTWRQRLYLLLMEAWQQEPSDRRRDVMLSAYRKMLDEAGVVPSGRQHNVRPT